MKLKASFICALLIMLTTQSCRYSLSGYEIKANTAQVTYFENQAPIQSAELSQIFTNKLEQKIIRETPLKLVQEDGQLQFSGAIVGYSLSPAAVSGAENTEKTELRITVQVEYVDEDDQLPDGSFNERFSASETFDSNLDLSSVENQLIESITEQLVQSIFNRAFIDW